jgi:hypothetical protein
MLILGIDPGPKHSGVVLFDSDAWAVDKAYCEPNDDILCDFRQWQGITLAIETMAAMGMAVAQDTFDTQLWAGRFIEAVDSRGGSIRDLKRKDVKLHLCGLTRAKDPNVRRAVMDKFAATGGGKEPRKGTKKQPGPLYGVSGNDVWSALAIAITAAETTKEAFRWRPCERCGEPVADGWEYAWCEKCCQSGTCRHDNKPEDYSNERYREFRQQFDDS